MYPSSQSSSLVRTVRIIPRLDVKGPNVVKGIHMEGLRVIDAPRTLARKYFEQGADELLYMDIVASLYGRSIDVDLVRGVAEELFIPLTVGGGIRSLKDIQNCLTAGADKVAINSYATKHPEFLREAAHHFGAQCIVLSVEAKRWHFADGTQKQGWEVYTDGGREHSGRDVVDWVKEALSYGIGEILLTSVDREGTRKGYDEELIAAIAPFADVPIIVNGGARDSQSMVQAVRTCKADAVGLATILHYDQATIGDLKKELAMSGIPVRPIHP
jgi:cyclase